MVADSERCCAATVMKDERLLMVVERILNRFDELVAEKAIVAKVFALLEVDDGDFSAFVAFDGELIKRNDSVVLVADVKVGDEWCGATEDSLAHLASEA